MGNFRECMVWKLFWYAVSALIRCIFFGTLAFFLAIVGVTIGTVIGTLSGLKTDRNVVRKAVIGGVAGGVVSIEVLRVFLSFFHPVNTSGLNCFFSLLDSAKYRIARKLVPDWYADPAATTSADTLKLKKIPISMKLTKKCLVVDSSGNRICCSICLQELEYREVAKRVPCCRQLFHLRCVDKWLVGHNSCPLCRRNVLETDEMKLNYYYS